MLKYKYNDFPANIYREVIDKFKQSKLNPKSLKMTYKYFSSNIDDIISAVLDEIGMEDEDEKTINLHIFYSRYEDLKNLTDIGEEVNMTRSQIQKRLDRIKDYMVRLVQFDSLESFKKIDESSSIYRLKLSGNLLNPIAKYGIDTIGLLVKAGPNILLDIPSVGPVGIKKIEESLNNNGFKFKK